MSKILKDDVVGLEFVNITKTVNNYDLFVVDEAHHMICKDPVWIDIRNNYFAKAKQRIILSDLSQNPAKIKYIKKNINFVIDDDEEGTSLHACDQLLAAAKSLIEQNEVDASVNHSRPLLVSLFWP